MVPFHHSDLPTREVSWVPLYLFEYVVKLFLCLYSSRFLATGKTNFLLQTTKIIKLKGPSQRTDKAATEGRVRPGASCVSFSVPQAITDFLRSCCRSQECFVSLDRNTCSFGPHPFELSVSLRQKCTPEWNPCALVRCSCTPKFDWIVLSQFVQLRFHCAPCCCMWTKHRKFLLERKHGRKSLCVFLHRVTPDKPQLGLTSDKERDLVFQNSSMFEGSVSFVLPLFVTSLRLEKVRSSIGAPVVSRATRPLV